jgi:hypothetical protein
MNGAGDDPLLDPPHEFLCTTRRASRDGRSWHFGGDVSPS